MTSRHLHMRIRHPKILQGTDGTKLASRLKIMTNIYVCIISVHVPQAQKLRHGPLSWWVLVDSSTMDTLFMEALPGVINGGRVMFEMRSVDGEWPTDRLIEDDEFRLFEVRKNRYLICKSVPLYLL